MHRRGEMGGGVLLQYCSSGRQNADFQELGKSWKRRKTPQKIIFEDDSKTTTPVVAKSYEKPKLSSSFFIGATPINRATAPGKYEQSYLNIKTLIEMLLILNNKSFKDAIRSD